MDLDKHPSTERSGAATDEMLMAEVQSGQRAMTELDRRYRARLLNWVRKSYLDEDEAEEVVQETFKKVWGAADTFATGRRFKPWLFSIAQHACTDILRRKQREASEVNTGKADDDDDSDGGSQIPVSLELGKDLEALDEFTKRLRQMHAVLLEGYSQLSTDVGFENFAVFLLNLRVRLAWKLIQSGFLDEQYSDELAADVGALPRIVDALFPWSDEWRTMNLKRLPSSPAIGKVWEAVVASGQRRDQWEIPARLICDAIGLLTGRQQRRTISQSLWWHWEWLAKNSIRDLLGPEKARPLEEYLRVRKRRGDSNCTQGS